MNLRTSILKTIAWFDLFDFPLTAEEVLEHLYDYKKPVHIKEVKGVLNTMTNDKFPISKEIQKSKIENQTSETKFSEGSEGDEDETLPEPVLEQIKDYYVLKGRGEIIEKRKTRKFIAEKYWNRVKLYGQYMRSVPFVRMIAVCNTLAYDNPNEQSDIDLFIVIKSGRMWLARLIITLILQFHGVRRHGDKIAGRFCLSFFVTEKKLDMGPLQIKPEDPYLAYWTKLLVPVYGEDMYEKFKTENSGWTQQYGLKFPEETKKHLYADMESKSKKFWERLLGGGLGDSAEKLLKKTFKKRTLRKMKHLDSNASVIVNDDMLKFHNHDRRREYYEKWSEITGSFSASG